MKQLAFLFVLLFASSLKAQEIEGAVEFTAQGQGYWTVMVNGEQVSQHTAEREAYESATNQLFISTGNAEVQVLHSAVVDVSMFVDYVPVSEPEVIEVPVEVIVEVPVIEYVEIEKEVIVEKIVEVEVIREVEVFIEVPVGDNVIEIPGSEAWTPAPQWSTVRRFTVLGDDYAVASSNQWLYVHHLDTVGDEAIDGFAVYRPIGERTPLTDTQIEQLITSVITN